MEDMSIQDLVSVLRTTYKTEIFDGVQEVLESRDKKLQKEIVELQEKLELEKHRRFQAEELCERHKNNYETLLKEVKNNAQGASSSSSSSDRENIGELRKKNDELESEVCDLRKLKKKWLDDSNALAKLRIKVCVLETSTKKNSELEKSTKMNNDALEALGVPGTFHLEDGDEENVGEYEIDNDIVELNPLQRNEPPNKRSKKAQATTQTRGATIDAAHSRHGNPITSFCRECVARHAPIVEEPQENANVHRSDKVIVMRSVVVPPSDVQEQMQKQNNTKRKMVATDASASSFDDFHFISWDHQDRYSNFLANKKFVEEKNFRLERQNISDIQAMIVARKWVKLTSFAKDASATLAKQFFANAYQNNKNDLKKFTSFVRGKKVPFNEKIINQLFGLENYEQCAFEARKAKGSNIDYQEIRNTLCRPETDWVRNKDGTPTRLRTSDLTTNAKAWATFVLRTLLPCSHVSDLTIHKATLVTAILKWEPINVGRLLADDLWSTANCSSSTSYINHASLISKLCERVKVYPKKNEEMVKSSAAITA